MLSRSAVEGGNRVWLSWREVEEVMVRGGGEMVGGGLMKDQSKLPDR